MGLKLGKMLKPRKWYTLHNRMFDYSMRRIHLGIATDVIENKITNDVWRRVSVNTPKFDKI